MTAEAHGVVWTLTPEHVSVDVRPGLRSTGKLVREHVFHTPAGRAVEHEVKYYFHSGAKAGTKRNGTICKQKTSYHCTICGESSAPADRARGQPVQVPRAVPQRRAGCAHHSRASGPPHQPALSPGPTLGPPRGRHSPPAPPRAPSGTRLLVPAEICLFNRFFLLYKFCI
jgi:hypothetical protein